MRRGTTIALVILLAVIFAAALIQFLVIAG